jgi:hypothetical protein
LLLDCLGQVAITQLELFKQANILDGDDRLVSEGLQERGHDDIGARIRGVKRVSGARLDG